MEGAGKGGAGELSLRCVPCRALRCKLSPTGTLSVKGGPHSPTCSLTGDDTRAGTDISVAVALAILLDADQGTSWVADLWRQPE